MIVSVDKMAYSFICYGHENITARHKNTAEFTKDAYVTKEGDCILGVKADFSFEGIQKFIETKIEDHGKKGIKKNNIAVKVIVEADGIKEEFTGLLNPDFNDAHEIVLRKGDFCSGRTLMIKTDKAAREIPDTLRKVLKNPDQAITVSLQ